MSRHSSGPRPGTWVTLLTVVALGVVSFFAYQASAAKDENPLAGPSGEETTGPSEGGTDDETGAAQDGGQDTGAAHPLPAESGQGRRIVYSVEQQRVWLVEISEDGTGEVVSQTHEVYPSSVDPPAGEYQISSRTPELTGSDGVPVEHILIFHVAADGIVFGFSSALDGSTPDPDGTQRTGGVRQDREDGDAMWLFAEVGTPVVVVSSPAA
ncbi:L,D-transpeptidase [Streptomyces sp. B6B3]|uniref:L,D-transpeptidase n=1 Tax=Streptomyces sp. B6B3 TaxID=3153570 RepID=UPI00325DE077